MNYSETELQTDILESKFKSGEKNLIFLSLTNSNIRIF